MKLSVMYWNEATTRSNGPLALRVGSGYDIIAVQEPWVSSQTKSIPCPKSSEYQLLFGGGRAAMYIHKRYDLAALETRIGTDWCCVTFGTGNEAITIWSIYSPTPLGRRWISPLNELPPQRQGQHVFVGDFNTHHPLWDLEGRTSRWSSDLLAFTKLWHLELATPYGEVTRVGKQRTRNRERDSTIDLAWATKGTRVTYEGDLGIVGSDHKAILIRIEVATPTLRDSRRQAEGWNWPEMDKLLVKAEAKYLLRLQLPIETADQLEAAFEWLIKTLCNIADASTPRRTPNTGAGYSWWCPETSRACARAKAAEHRWLSSPSELTWLERLAAIRTQRIEIGAAQARSWYRALEETAKSPRKLWSLQKWARLRSTTSAEPPGIPELSRSEKDTHKARTHSEKAALLAERFFPNPPADLSDLDGPQQLPTSSFAIKKEVTSSEVAAILRNTAAWKSPGEDLLPVGFLRACGQPVYDVLATLISKSFELAYYPKRFRSARVAIIPKPNKTKAEKQTPGGWRPIALLSTVGKVIEAAMTERITGVAEANNLLPHGQMGNRTKRSTELAIRVVTDVIRTTWARGGIASLLQLDIAGAFDTVNYKRLIAILQAKGYPEWVLLWVRSFVTDRSVRLRFDSAESEPILLHAGVPQGSPLSPILFLLYIATLYDVLAADERLITVGFADDSNLISVGFDEESNCRQLELAWEVCTTWAKAHGMEFAPKKSELIHFSRAHTAPSTRIRLGDATITPIESARFLGVWLDRKLKWNAHIARIKQKMTIQTLALTKLVTLTQGANMVRARQLYTMVVRPTIAYGSTAWHTPGVYAAKTQQLARIQNDCLRVICGAHQKTPIRYLESETVIPPLDIYLDSRNTAFERRIAIAQKSYLLRGASAKAAYILDKSAPAKRVRFEGTTKSKPFAIEYTLRKAELAERWADGESVTGALYSRWNRRWIATASQHDRQRRAIAETGGPRERFPKRGPYHLLSRKEATLLFHIRTGWSRFNALSFKTGAPGVYSPLCRCGDAPETSEHIILGCEILEYRRERLRSDLAPLQLHSRIDLERVASEPLAAQKLVRWLLGINRMSSYFTGVTEELD